jgi:RNA polymerase sigma factor (sigma-70 family)
MTQPRTSSTRVYRALRERRASQQQRLPGSAGTLGSVGQTGSPAGNDLIRITRINPTHPANLIGRSSAGSGAGSGAGNGAGHGVIAIELASVAGGGSAFRNPLAPMVPERVLLPVIGANDELLPSFERTLEPIAHRAWSGDRAARDALYAAFEPKLMRFARSIHVPFAPPGTFAIWDRHDVAQEAYLAFLDVIASWTPHIPFGRYVLAHFPWRLRDVVYRGLARSVVPSGLVVVSEERIDWIGDATTAAAESRVLLESLAESFDSPYDDILRWHIGDGESLMTIAGRLGCSRRTVTRRWRVVLDRLRSELGVDIPA